MEKPYDEAAERAALIKNETVKNFMEKPLLKVGDTEFGYEVEDKEAVIGMLTNTNKFWNSLIDKEGKPDMQKLIKVMAFAANPDKYDKDVLALAKDLGKEEYLKEQKNTKSVVDKVIDHSKAVDDDKFDADEFLKEAIRQKNLRDNKRR